MAELHGGVPRRAMSIARRCSLRTTGPVEPRRKDPLPLQPGLHGVPWPCKAAEFLRFLRFLRFRFPPALSLAAAQFACRCSSHCMACAGMQWSGAAIAALPLPALLCSYYFLLPRPSRSMCADRALARSEGCGWGPAR